MVVVVSVSVSVSVSVVVVSDSEVVSEELSSGDLHPVRIIPSKIKQIRKGSNFLMGPPNSNLDKRICVLR